MDTDARGHRHHDVHCLLDLVHVPAADADPRGADDRGQGRRQARGRRLRPAGRLGLGHPCDLAESRRPAARHRPGTGGPEAQASGHGEEGVHGLEQRQAV